jgi:probable phosphoglycerate mutase
MPGGGESLNDVDRRLSGFLDSLGDFGVERIAIVSHNFVIRAAICRLLGLGVDRFRAFGVDVASIAQVDVGPGGVAILSLNDVCHLRGVDT